ncbi:MAG: hypothetical protein BalsKO_15670 [Balneolaceae bacterium]
MNLNQIFGINDDINIKTETLLFVSLKALNLQTIKLRFVFYEQQKERKSWQIQLR